MPDCYYCPEPGVHGVYEHTGPNARPRFHVCDAHLAEVPTWQTRDQPSERLAQAIQGGVSGGWRERVFGRRAS